MNEIYNIKVSDEKLLSFISQHSINIKIDSTKKGNFRGTSQNKSIVVIMNDDENIFGSKYKYGINFWDKTSLILNFKIERINKEIFSELIFARERCIIPMSTFSKLEMINNKKIHFDISLLNEEIFFVPGIYNIDRKSLIILSTPTTISNYLIKSFNYRMPLILDLKEAINYLNADSKKSFEKSFPYKFNENIQMEEAILK